MATTELMVNRPRKISALKLSVREAKAIGELCGKVYREARVTLDEKARKRWPVLQIQLKTAVANCSDYFYLELTEDASVIAYALEVFYGKDLGQVWYSKRDEIVQLDVSRVGRKCMSYQGA